MAKFLDSTGCQTLIKSLATKIKNYLPLSGGAITGQLNFNKMGYIEPADDQTNGIYINSNNLYIDVDGYITAPDLLLATRTGKTTFDDGNFRIYYNGTIYKLDVQTMIDGGLLVEA